MTTGITEARAAKDKLAREFASLSDIVGIGLTRNGTEWAVKINLAQPIAGDILPQEVDGVAVLTEVVGPIDSR